MDLINIFHTQEQRDDFTLRLLEATGEMIVIFDKNLNILLLNESCEKNFNIKDEAARGKNLFEIFPHVKGSQSHQDLLKALAGETIRNGSKKSSDNKFYIENKLVPLKSAEGEVIAVMAIARNITQQVDSDTAILEAHKKITDQNEVLLDRNNFVEAILNESVDAIMVVNKERELISLNNYGREILKPFTTELLGKKMEEILPHIKNTIAWDKFYEALDGNKAVIKEYKSLVNEKYWEINFSPLTKFNTIYAVLVICHDITGIILAKKQIEHSNRLLKNSIEELRVSEERYHKMVEDVQDYAIILLDAEGNIQNWNKGAEKIKGYPAAEIIGKSFTLFYTAEDQKNKLPIKLLDNARTEGKAAHEGWRVRKGGELFWGSVVITALKDKEKSLIGFSKVTRDLTAKKIADDNLRKQAEILVQKNADLEKLNKELQSFAYVASHDLQEPLRKIQFFGNLIVQKEADNLSETGKDYFRRMQEASKRMQLLIEDLLSFSRTNDGERVFERMNLNKIVNEVIFEMRESINEKSAKIIVGEMVEIEIIPFQFRQLIQNLISNALKFSIKVGSPQIEIFTSAVKISDLPTAMPTKNLEYIKLTVKDNGIGFEPEYKERIFDIFQRLHGKHEYKGTGIGLAICKKIAENHNGLIMAEGIPGEGASFILYLPTQQPFN
ncbi:MAG: PAS domain S-box protein [Ferruginibacter sp.]